MKTITITTTFLTVVAPSLVPAAVAENSATKATVITGLTSMPLAFTENQGQWDEQVLFRADASGATMWFTRDGAYYQLTRRIRVGRQPCAPDISEQDVGTTGVPTYGGTNVTLSGVEGPSGAPQLAVGSERFRHEPDSIESIVIKANFVGSKPTPRVVGEGLLEYKCHYFLGNNPAKWHADVPNYQSIVYENIYPGIDLKYYGNGKQMEYDFIVSPGGDPSQITVRYEGAKSLSVDAAGRLVVETDWGEVIEQPPVGYQISGGDRVSLAGEYVLKGDKAFGFELPDGYEADLPVVIDPTLDFSTYLGGSGLDKGYDIAVDESGAAYVTGETYSTDFPTENPYQGTLGGIIDVFVTKLSSSGSSLVYSTYLGGNMDDYGDAIAVDASGAAYVTGSTESTDFPTLNPYQTDQGAEDVFVTKLSAAGNSLVYSTYLGSGGYDWGYGIAVDASGAAYVTGATWESDFPTLNPYQTDQGGEDVFVTKLSAGGNSLVYSTYLGGGSWEVGYGIAADAAGAAYVTGYTFSPDFPTLNPYQTDQGDRDAFVTKLSAAGNSLIYSTYLGGGVNDYAYDIAIDAAGAAYVTGRTYSTDFPTLNPYQTDQGGRDVFVTKLSAAGNGLVYSTYLGGSDLDWGWSIAVDISGEACVTGETHSTDFPTENPYQADQGAGDVFVTRFSSSGSSLVYSTYLGGNENDEGYGIAVDTSGAYVTGYTLSTDFPTENPYHTYQGDYDVFVAKIAKCCNHDGIRGDADHSMALNVGDLSYLVDHLFGHPPGPAPPCTEEGDVDGSGAINVADVTYLVEYLFFDGPAPPPCP